MQKLAELTTHCHSAGFADKKDSDAARAEVGMSDLHSVLSSAGGRQEARWSAPPQITWDPEKGSIVMERATEVRWTLNRTVRKEIQVEGETWTRESIEAQVSSWFRGSPEIVVVHVWSGEIVEIG
jgi:hypothetical protein